MMENNSKEFDEIHRISLQMKQLFSSGVKEEDQNLKWSMLKEYKFKYLQYVDESQTLVSSYYSILLNLLECLRPTLFSENWQEKLYDSIFLDGIHHAAFMILVRRLGEISASYEQQKIIDLLQKFLQGSKMESLCLYQCISSGAWNLKYISMSKIWEDLITFIISLPERMANRTKGQMNKIFSTHFYIPLLVSSVLKVLTMIHERIVNSQDCSLEFLGKLIGRLCIAGHADLVAKRLCVEFIKVTEKDFIWRRIIQNLITKMPSRSLESFITNLLLVIPWHGYVEWILGEEGIKNQKLNYIMTVKLLFFHHFEKVSILRNIIGYFADSNHCASDFWKILNALLASWSDGSALKHQSFDQQMYITSALMICAGWIKMNNVNQNNKAYMERVLHGVQIRIGNSEESICSLGMIVGDALITSLDPDAPKLEFEFSDLDQLHYLRSLMEIHSKPERDSFIHLEGLKCFEEVESEKAKWNQDSAKPNESVSFNPKDISEIDSDDDLEPYDMSNDIPQGETKRPLYLRDCMMGLIEQEKPDWAEQCLKHAENLIRANTDILHEVAVEMAKILLHLDDKFSIDNFIALRHRALIGLTVNCPVLVANYLTSQFYERDYNIRQRLDILEVLAAASRELSQPNVEVKDFKPSYSKEKFVTTTEQHWKSIIDQRLEAKTRHITKTPRRPQPVAQDNRFSSVAGYFFFPLMEKYDKQNQVLKLLGEDSYVLGRLIYTLGIIMYSAANIPLSKQMGVAFLEFLTNVQNHEDVFVRQAAIFATAAVYMSVPGYLLVSDMLAEVLESQQWLQSIIENDPDFQCQMKATHALSMILSILKEEMPSIAEI